MSTKTMRAIVLQVSTEKYKNLGLVSVTFELYAGGYFVDVKSPSLKKILDLLDHSMKQHVEVTVSIEGNRIVDVAL